jgi:hypothetical protein
MRQTRTKPDQLDLFDPLERTRPLQTPQWHSLPDPARHKITRLMARLLMAHGSKGAAVSGEEVPVSRQAREGGDVRED